MVERAVVGQYAIDGHANKVWECSQGHGQRYLARVTMAGKQQKKKNSNKPARKHTNKEKKVHPKGTPPIHTLYQVTSQKRQRKKNKKHTKSAEAAGSKIQPTQTTKMATCYYGLKKINNSKKNTAEW